MPHRADWENVRGRPRHANAVRQSMCASSTASRATTAWVSCQPFSGSSAGPDADPHLVRRESHIGRAHPRQRPPTAEPDRLGELPALERVLRAGGCGPGSRRT